MSSPSMQWTTGGGHKGKMKGQKRVGEEWPIEGRTPSWCNQLTADLAVHIAGPAIELLDEAQVRWLLRGTHHPHGHLGPRLDTGDAVRHDLWCRASEVAGGGGDRSIDVMESVDRDRDHESRDQLVWFADWGRVRRGGREDTTYLYVLRSGHPRRRRRRRRSVCSCVGVSCSGCVPSRPSDRKGSGHQALSRGLLLTQVCQSPQKVNSCACAYVRYFASQREILFYSWKQGEELD